MDWDATSWSTKRQDILEILGERGRFAPLGTPVPLAPLHSFFQTDLRNGWFVFCIMTEIFIWTRCDRLQHLGTLFTIKKLQMPFVSWLPLLEGKLASAAMAGLWAVVRLPNQFCRVALSESRKITYTKQNDQPFEIHLNLERVLYFFKNVTPPFWFLPPLLLNPGDGPDNMTESMPTMVEHHPCGKIGCTPRQC